MCLHSCLANPRLGTHPVSCDESCRGGRVHTVLLLVALLWPLGHRGVGGDRAHGRQGGCRACRTAPGEVTPQAEGPEQQL